PSPLRVSASFYILYLSSLLSPFPFSFTHPATTDIYTLSLHDALPIYWWQNWWHTRTDQPCLNPCRASSACAPASRSAAPDRLAADRKSTRLNSSHGSISYAVFCLKKKKKKLQSK